MLRGLYTSGWSMLANSKKMDVIANNLANINTNAYKKDTVVFESFSDVLTKRLDYVANNSAAPVNNIGSMELGSDVGEVFTYYSQGQLTKTGNNLDLAISNSNTAFFTIGIPDAEGNLQEYYTRDGAFTLNSDGLLCTKEGYPVLGEKGPITLTDGEFIVQDDGTIVQNGRVIDTLLIRNFTDASTLRKYGSNLVQSMDNNPILQEFTGNVLQGYIEQSNVNVIREMVDMMSVLRAYEANQKILQAQDGTLEKAVNEVGAVR